MLCIFVLRAIHLSIVHFPVQDFCSKGGFVLERWLSLCQMLVILVLVINDRLQY
jgi:hypothetical protein